MRIQCLSLALLRSVSDAFRAASVAMESDPGKRGREGQSPLANVHGRKPKNYGDIYNVRTGGRGGQGYPDTVDRFRCGQPPAASVEHQQQPGSSGAGNIQSWSAASRGVVGVAGNEGRLLAVRIQEV